MRLSGVSFVFEMLFRNPSGAYTVECLSTGNEELRLHMSTPRLTGGQKRVNATETKKEQSDILLAHSSTQ